MHRIIRLVATSVAALGVVFSSNAAFAAPTVILSFKMNTYTVESGKDFGLEVAVEPGGDKINIMQACVKYDHDKFDYVRTTYDGSPLTADVPKSPNTDCAAGSVQMSRYDLTNQPSDNFTLGTIIFRPKVQSGVATMTFDFEKSLAFGLQEPGTNILKETGSAQLTITPASAPTTTSKPNDSKAKNALYLIVALFVVGLTIGMLIRKRKKPFKLDEPKD